MSLDRITGDRINGDLNSKRAIVLTRDQEASEAQALKLNLPCLIAPVRLLTRYEVKVHEPPEVYLATSKNILHVLRSKLKPRPFWVVGEKTREAISGEGYQVEHCFANSKGLIEFLKTTNPKRICYLRGEPVTTSFHGFGHFIDEVLCYEMKHRDWDQLEMEKICELDQGAYPVYSTHSAISLCVNIRRLRSRFRGKIFPISPAVGQIFQNLPAVDVDFPHSQQSSAQLLENMCSFLEET